MGLDPWGLTLGGGFRPRRPVSGVAANILVDPFRRLEYDTLNLGMQARIC